MGKEDKLSIFISLVPRHNPGVAGIQLDEHGCANLEHPTHITFVLHFR